MRFPLTLLFSVMLVLLLSGCSGPARPVPSASAGSLVQGKLTFEQQALAGGWLEAYPVESADLAQKPPYRSQITQVDGQFQLRLPPGEYYLLARGPELFAFYGRNPVTVPAAGLERVNLALVKLAAGGPDGEPFLTSGFYGQVTEQGKPLAGAMVNVYLDLSSELKGMGYVLAGPTDREGRFEASLPPGTYYLLARKRQNGTSVGPLRAGDVMGYYPGNPIHVGPDQILRGTIPMLEVPEKVDALAGSLFGSTVISGVIKDQQGAPLSGLRAVLYDDPQMLNRPLYVSQPTEADGRFVLSFPHGGTYYLAARNTLGGAPAPGDLYGTYDGSPDHALHIKDGEKVGPVDILVEAVW